MVPDLFGATPFPALNPGSDPTVATGFPALWVKNNTEKWGRNFVWTGQKSDTMNVRSTPPQGAPIMIRSSIIACATIAIAIVCASFVGHYLQHVFASITAALAI